MVARTGAETEKMRTHPRVHVGARKSHVGHRLTEIRSRQHDASPQGPQQQIEVASRDQQRGRKRQLPQDRIAHAQRGARVAQASHESQHPGVKKKVGRSLLPRPGEPLQQSAMEGGGGRVQTGKTQAAAGADIDRRRLRVGDEQSVQNRSAHGGRIRVVQQHPGQRACITESERQRHHPTVQQSTRKRDIIGHEKSLPGR